VKHLNRITEKLKEADFFLGQMAASQRKVDELNYYFSAFTSAARSVTFVLQYVGSTIDGFVEWYESVQMRQRRDPVAKYLLEARNEGQKTAAQPIAYGQMVTLPTGEEKLISFFSYVGSEPPAAVPDMDVLSTCTHQMRSLICIVSEFFERFEEIVWDASKERRDIVAQFTQLRPIIHGGATPGDLWQKAVDFLGSQAFKLPRPSDAIQALVEKYAKSRGFSRLEPSYASSTK
jgi:hypothetical protein